MSGLRLLAAFFGARRIAKLAGFYGGTRRSRQERQVVLASVVYTFAVASVLTALHLVAVKEVPR